MKTNRTSTPATKTKSRNPRRILATSAAALVALCVLPTAAKAQTQFWDVNGVVAGFGGTSNWNLVTPNWNDATGLGAPAVWGNLAGSDATFQGTAGIVTVSVAGVQVNEMLFNATGYTVTGANGLALVGGTPNNISVSNPGDSATISVALTGAGNVVINGAAAAAGTVIFAGSNANTYAGGTNVVNGTLQLNNGGFNAAIPGNLTIGDGVGGANSAVVQLLQISEISNTSRVQINSDGQFDLAGNSETVGSVNGVAGSSIALGTSTLTTGGDNLAATYQGIISDGAGVGTVTKTGTAVWTLAGANTYDGQTNVQGGILEVGNNSALGSTTGGTVVTGGATLRLILGVAVGAEALTLNGAGANANEGALSGFGTVTYGGAINALTSSTITAGGGTLTLNGPITKNGTTLTFGTSTSGGGTTIVNGVISGALPNSDLVVESQTVVLNNANIYNGPTTIRSSGGVGLGVLNANAAGALPDPLFGGPARSVLTMDDVGLGGSVLNLNGGFGQVVASLTGAASSVVNLNTSTLTVGTGAGTTTFAGTINGLAGPGNVSIIKDGASTQVFSGPNTYLGLTNVNAGTLQLGNASALGNTGLGTNVASGATLDLNGQNVGVEAISITGIGTAAAVGALSNSNAGTPASLAGILTIAGTATVGGAGNISLDGKVTGGGLTKDGAGTVFLTNNANDYTTTTITTGILQVGGATVGGGSTGVLGSGAVVNNATLNFNRNNALVVANAISGGGAVNQNGIGITSLNGANSYNGATTVNAGTLKLGNVTALGSVLAGTTVVAGATLDLNGQAVGAEAVSIAGNGDAGNLQIAALTNNGVATATLAGQLTLTAAATVGSNAGDISLDGGIAGAFGLTKVGTDIVFITNSTNGSTTTTISGGTLQVGGPAAGGTAAGALGGGAVTNNSILSINRNNAINIANAIGGNGVLNQIGSSAASVTTLSGANTYTGQTNVNAGTLQLGNVAALGSAVAGTVVASGATLDLNGLALGGEAVSIAGIGVGGTGALTNTNAAASTFAGPLALTAAANVGGNAGSISLDGAVSGSALTKVGTNTVFLTNNGNSYTTTTISGGILQVGAGGTSGVLGGGVVTNNATLNFNRSDTFTVSNVISGAGAVNQNGTGTTNLSGANVAYNGVTTVNAGVLEVQNNAALGTAVGGTTVAAGTLRLANGIVLGAEALTLNGHGTGAANALGALTVTAGGTATVNGPITVAANSTIHSNGGTLNLNGGINKTGVHLVLNNTGGGTTNVNGAITGDLVGFNDDLVANGGTTNLIVANNYVGPTWLINGATVNANVANALPNSTNANLALRTTVEFEDQTGATPVVLAAGTGGSILNVNSNQAAQWIDGSFGAVPASTINLNGNTLNIGTTALPNGSVAPPLGGTPNFAGIIAGGTGAPGAGVLIKDGNNTQILSGANTYTGATTVNGGTLQAGVATVTGVGGAVVSGAFGVNSAVTVATVAPFTPATLELAGFNNTIGSLSDGGTFPATGVVSNTLLGGATLTIAGTNAAGAAGAVAFSGTIVDTAATPLQLVKNGAGTQSLSGANTYTGILAVPGAVVGNLPVGTILNAGTLNIDASSTTTLAAPGPFDGAPAVAPGAAPAAPGALLSGPLGTGALVINGGEIGTGTGTTAALPPVNTNNAIGNVVQINGNFSVSNIVLPAGVLPAAVNFPSPAGTPIAADGGVLNSVAVGLNSDGVSFTGPVFLNQAVATVITTNSGFLDLTGVIADAFVPGGGLTFTGNTATYIGSSGVGGIAGTVGQIDASNTYAGLTTVNGSAGGTLVVLGKNSGAFAIPGNLQIDAGATVLFDSGAVVAPNAPGLVTTPNQINPTSTVTVNGTLDISGINQAVNILNGGGTVRLDDSAFANVGAAGDLTANSGVFSGSIVDAGAGGRLIKTTTGNLILSGPSTYVGSTNVQAGNLIVNGSLTSSVFVQLGAALAGVGSTTRNVINGGTFSPGRGGSLSVGRFNIGGNYNQTAGGTLVIDIAGRLPGQSDLVAVTGTANLNGTLRLVNVGGTKLKVGDKITFLTANGGVNGQFANEINPFSTSGTIVQTEVVYHANFVSLESKQGSFSRFGRLCNPNAKAVGQALDNLVASGRNPKLINLLNGVLLTDLCRDLDLIAPEELQAIFTIGISQANVQTANLSRRMDDLRSGAGGFSDAGYSISGGETQYSANYLATNQGLAGPMGKMSKEMRPPVDNTVGFFATGTGEFTDIGSTNNARGYNLSSAGFTLGVDYRVNENFAIGVNVGYSRTNADISGGGKINTDGLKLGLYATYFRDGFYVDGSVQGGYNTFDTRRTALRGSATGSTDGTDFNALLAFGYDWRRGGLTVGPTASLQYTHVGFDSFGENGSQAALNYSSQSSDSLRSALGMKASYEIQAGTVIIKPEVRAAWQHEFGDSAYGIRSQIANGGAGFTVNGPDIGADSLLLGAGVAVLWNERTATYVYYDGELGRSNYQSNNVSGGLRLEF